MKVQLCRSQLGAEIRSGTEVVYCDETLFTRHTFKQQEYAPSKTSYKLSQSELHIPAVWAVAFVSSQRGLIHVQTYKGELNHDLFYQYVNKASIKMNR